MSLPQTTLSTLQQAGASVFAADAALKNAVKDYAERVNAAMSINPFGLGNDGLFENWKLVARLSQTVAGIEEELKKVYQLATELTAEDGPAVHSLPALASPTQPTAAAVPGQPDMVPTDVVVKTRKKKATASASAAKPSPKPVGKPVAKPVAQAAVAPVAKKAPTRPAAAPGAPQAPGGNPARLLRHLEGVLNSNEFSAINQSACGLATGIPLGSVNAAVKKLIETGRLVAGPAGSFKLAS
jgi:hypothetical protein